MGSWKALILLGAGAEEIEFVTIADVLRRGGIDVTIAGIEGADCVKCSRGVKICPDVALKDVLNKEYDLIALPGGDGGTDKMKASPQVGKLLQEQEKKDKWIAAICAAPTVLQAYGIGKGKRITSYPRFKEQFVKDENYKYIEENTVVDGKLITSRGPATASEFALTIVEILVGKCTKDEVAQALLYPTS